MGGFLIGRRYLECNLLYSDLEQRCQATPAPSETEIKASIHETIAKIKQLVPQSAQSLDGKNIEKAGDAAFDAYLVHETIEALLIAKEKSLGLRLKTNFGRLRGEIKRQAPKTEIDLLVKKLIRNSTR